MPKTSPNQKKITIHTVKPPKDKIYTMFDRKVMEEAIKNMNGRQASGFLLWCYLSLNKDGYELSLSNEAVKEAIGISKDAYDTAIKLLIDKGYLVLRSGATVYDFYQVPKKG